MSLATHAIEKPVHTWMLILFCLFGGLWAVVSIGKLEDPAFTIKQAVILTDYPGASAVEVEQQITELLETALQQLPQLKHLESRSTPGNSRITVEIKDRYRGAEVAQTWDELRRRVHDVQPRLPPGAKAPQVIDDFGDVFGIYYAVRADGFTTRERYELADFLRRELLTLPGVARVETAGVLEERIYVEIPRERLSALELSLSQLAALIQVESVVVQAGDVVLGDRRVRLRSEALLGSADAVEDLRIGIPGTTRELSVGDVATVIRSDNEIPAHLIRHNGQPAFTLAVSALADANIVEVGAVVDAYLDALRLRIPAGVDIQPIYQQHVVVAESIDSFMANLVLSVSIVIAVLCLAMGWRIGVAVGATLLLTVLGSVFFMKLFGMEMQRISLGALIIAMGMLVDNAIVVAESMLVAMQRGLRARQAAAEATTRTQMPLLGATVIGLMAFAGIGLSQDVTGEFLFSLAAVIAISLLLSWLLAVTVTPLFGHYLFGRLRGGDGDALYGGVAYQRYRAMLALALRHQWKTIAALVALTALAIAGFTAVKQDFLPPSDTPLFTINYFKPQGSDIRATERDVIAIEAALLRRPEVESVTSYVGQGGARFMLTYSPEAANAALGHLIVRLQPQHRARMDALMAEVQEEVRTALPDSEIYLRRLMFGPGDGAKIEARFSGSDPMQLRALAERAQALMQHSGAVVDLRHDWRQRELVLVPRWHEAHARTAGVTRADLAEATAFATVGIRSGSFYEDERQIPIILRPPQAERLEAARLDDRLIWSAAEGRYIPLAQVVDGFAVDHEEALIQRRDRVRTLTVQGEPAAGLTADAALRQVRAAVEGIARPHGYRLEWGGEYENSQRSRTSLGATLPGSFLVMLVITVLLFNAWRQALVVWLIVPMAICGVTAGLLLTGMPFSFTALLGLLSLSGMLMKNAIVLIDEIDNRRSGKAACGEAVMEASVSRIRPVVLTALTTVLGMLPLLWDAFFASMAVTIIGGLAFATVLTLVAVPVFYARIFGIRAATSQGDH